MTSVIYLTDKKVKIQRTRVCAEVTELTDGRAGVGILPSLPLTPVA